MKKEATSRMKEILKMATRLHDGNSTIAKRWLNSPQRVLGGDTPMERAKTEKGAEDVVQLIGRLEHGVYS